MFTLSGPIHEWVAYRCRSSPATAALLAHHLDLVSRCGLADVARTCQDLPGERASPAYSLVYDPVHRLA